MADATGIVNGQTAQESNFSGMLIPYAGPGTPAGFLLCDGSAVSRTGATANLFAVLGTTYGIGDGSTTFNLPDMRGRVIVGTGTGVKIATIASVAGNVITVTGLTNANNNEYQTGQAIVFTAGVAGNLANGVTYYVIRVSNTTFSVATTLANAQNGTVITLAGTETGSFALTLTARTIADTGGEENHAMSAAELLSHSHNLFSATSAGGIAGVAATLATGPFPTTNKGGNAAMNDMMPFIVLRWLIKT
jgi:microcystin-dependent protein